MGSVTRRDLDTLPTYGGSRRLEGVVNLTTNELPYGPLPGVTEAVTEAVAHVHRYPDIGAPALREALAQWCGVSVDRVVTGCGSMAVIEHLVKVTCLPGAEVVYARRSFDVYRSVVAGAGATPVPVGGDGEYAHDLEAMARAINDRTRLVVVCSPNNPTGAVVRRAEFDAFLDAVPSDVLVVLDEAYHEFVSDPDVPDSVRAYGDRPNVAIARSMSKGWGLAGLRVGYLVASVPVVAVVRKVVTPWSTSSVGQAAALAALRAADEMRHQVELVVAERRRLTNLLREVFPEVPESHANFIWLPLGGPSWEFAQECELRGVLVRSFPGEGVRVTIGTPEENDAFLAVAIGAARDRTMAFTAARG